MDHLASLKQQFEMSTQRSGNSPLVALQGQNLQESLSVVSEHARRLSENPLYAPHLVDLPDGFLKESIAMQMDNYHRATQHLSESTKSSALATFDKYAFDIIRAVLPEMATDRLFSTQSMFGPTSMVFYFDYVYGTSRGSVTAGQRLFENHDPAYGDSKIENEINVPAPNGTTKTFEFNLSYFPVTPGTIDITDGEQILTDDGNGGFQGDGTGSIDYNSGAVEITFTENPTAGAAVTSDYDVDNEGNEEGVPEIDLVLTSSPVVARSKKLRTRFSLEAQLSLRDTLGLDAEAEAVTALGAEIAYGIDTMNMDNVKRIATDKRTDNEFTFDRKSPDGVAWRDHKESLVDYFIKCSDAILRISGRAIGNKIVVGSNVANVIESLVPRFSPVPIRAARGIHFIGTLDGRWEIFKDLRMDPDEYLMLFKGEEMLFAGYIFAPWVLAFTTPSVMLDDFQTRKGMASLFAQKVVNSKYFLRAKIKKTA